MAARLVFTRDSSLNTTLVDEARGAMMYEIETEGGFFSKTTIVRKPYKSAPSFRLILFSPVYAKLGHLLSIDSRGEVVPHTSTEVARILWKTWSPDRIIYYGAEMKVKEFMPPAGTIGG